MLALLGAFDRPELASYDIEFFTETSEDSEFAEALAEAGNVILARKMAYCGNRWTLPAPVLRRHRRVRKEGVPPGPRGEPLPGRRRGSSLAPSKFP